MNTCHSFKAHCEDNDFFLDTLSWEFFLNIFRDLLKLIKRLAPKNVMWPTCKWTDMKTQLTSILRLLAPKILKKNNNNNQPILKSATTEMKKNWKRPPSKKKKKRAERNYHYPIQQKTTIIMIMISVFCPNSQWY